MIPHSHTPLHGSLQRGFTLVELMYAVGLFSIGLVGLTSFQTASASATRTSCDVTMATNLTSATMEELYVTRYTDLTGTATRYFSDQGVETAAPSYFTVTWTATPQTSYIDLEVVTTWERNFESSVSEHEHRVRLTSRLF